MKDETAQRGGPGRPAAEAQTGTRLLRLLLYSGAACLALFLLFIGVRGAGRMAVRVFLTENPHFTLQEIKVTVNGNLRQEEILRRLEVWNVKKGKSNLFALDIPELRERLAKFVMVSKADFQIVLPSKLEVTVTERVPVVRLAGGNGRLLDAEGWMLPPMSAAEQKTESLPLVSNLKSAELTPTGKKAEDEMTQGVLRFLHLINTRPYGRLFDVKRIACDTEQRQLRVLLRARSTFVEDAQMIVPATSDVEIDAALFRVEKIAADRMLGQLKTRFIDATYVTNVPVLGAIDPATLPPGTSGVESPAAVPKPGTSAKTVTPKPATPKPHKAPAKPASGAVMPFHGTGSAHTAASATAHPH